MNIEQLVKMANQIGQFFQDEPDPDKAVAEIRNHLTKFWAPAMRKQLILWQQTQPDSGLYPAVALAVTQLGNQAAERVGGG